MKNLIIFDIDGTLCNTKKVDEQCYEKAFEIATGQSIDNVDYESFEHMTDQSIWEESHVYLGLEHPDADRLMNMQQTHHSLLKARKAKEPNRFLEIPGAKKFYRDLLSRTDEFQIGFATGAWDFSAEFKLNNIGIDPGLFPFSNSSCFRTREEIVSDCIRKAENLVQGRTYRRLIYLGDGAWDLKTCKNLELEFIGIDIEGNGRLKDLGANYVFKDLSDMDAIYDLIIGEETFLSY